MLLHLLLCVKIDALIIFQGSSLVLIICMLISILTGVSILKLVSSLVIDFFLIVVNNTSHHFCFHVILISALLYEYANIALTRIRHFSIIATIRTVFVKGGRDSLPKLSETIRLEHSEEHSATERHEACFKTTACKAHLLCTLMANLFSSGAPHIHILHQFLQRFCCLVCQRRW